MFHDVLKTFFQECLKRASVECHICFKGVSRGCSMSPYWVFLRCFRERSSITSARLRGWGGLSHNADTADALEGGGGVKMLTC